MSKYILAVDDDPAISDLVKQNLEDAGYQVFVANDGKEAERYLNAMSFDLLVTDIFMPEKDGLELLQKLRQKNRGLKIVAMSGGGGTFAPDVFLKMAKKLGAQRTFEKPFDWKEFVAAVRELLDETQDVR